MVRSVPINCEYTDFCFVWNSLEDSPTCTRQIAYIYFAYRWRVHTQQSIANSAKRNGISRMENFRISHSRLYQIGFACSAPDSPLIRVPTLLQRNILDGHENRSPPRRNLRRNSYLTAAGINSWMIARFTMLRHSFRIGFFAGSAAGQNSTFAKIDAERCHAMYLA